MDSLWIHLVYDYIIDLSDIDFIRATSLGSEQ